MNMRENGEHGAKLAGPAMEDNSIRHVNEPPSQYSVALNSAKFLIRRSRYPNAVPPTSLISLDGRSDDEVAHISRVVLLACLRFPGSMVFGAKVFITGEYEDEAIEFLMAAGFSRADAERIAPPGWSFQFSTQYLKRDEAAKELPDNAAEEELCGGSSWD